MAKKEERYPYGYKSKYRKSYNFFSPDYIVEERTPLKEEERDRIIEDMHHQNVGCLYLIVFTPIALSIYFSWEAFWEFNAYEHWTIFGVFVSSYIVVYHTSRWIFRRTAERSRMNMKWVTRLHVLIFVLWCTMNLIDNWHRI